MKVVDSHFISKSYYGNDNIFPWTKFKS